MVPGMQQEQALTNVFHILEALGWVWPATAGREQPVAPAIGRSVDLPGHGMLVADEGVDLTGETCLRTNLVAKRVLDAARAGAVIAIATDNLSSVETLPFMLAGHGCVHLGTIHSEAGWRIYARKTAADNEGASG